MASVSSYLQSHRIHRQLQFHGYGNCKNSEDGIKDFLKVLEDYYGDASGLTILERSIMLAAFTHHHLRGDALLFAKGLPESVHQQWPRLFTALIEKYDQKPESLKTNILDSKTDELAEIKVKKSNDHEVTTFDIKRLESEMNALIVTTDERTRVLLSVFLVLRTVCHMICTIASVGKERKSAEDKMKLNLKTAEQPLKDQSEDKLAQLEKRIDLKSEEILKAGDSLDEESKSRLEKGIVERFCILCCPLNHVNRFVVCYVKLMEGWRDVFVANDICFVGKMHRLGIG